MEVQAEEAFEFLIQYLAKIPRKYFASPFGFNALRPISAFRMSSRSSGDRELSFLAIYDGYSTLRMHPHSA